MVSHSKQMFIANEDLVSHHKQEYMADTIRIQR